MHSGISMVIDGVRVPRQRVIDAVSNHSTVCDYILHVQAPNSLWYVMFLYMKVEKVYLL